MQLKKMREILPTLYASQVNEEHRSFTTSPKQASVDKASPTKRKDKNQNCSYQKTEEIQSNQITCVKCRCMQETSALELQKEKCQQGGNSPYLCSKCMPSVVNFVTDPTGVSDTENKEKRSPSQILRTFKLKNFQPDKYYCDKCRFSTKDPLQYKKHITQHEEIKFVCSHCNCVSFTKGEFQRHLVKHTGKFPYQCRYCEYGAIRHDYIVKHIKRLHKTITDKQVKPTVEKAERNTNCLTKQNIEKRRLTQEVPLPNKSSNVYFNTMMDGIQDEMPEMECTPSSAECSQGTAFIQDKNIVEPSDSSIHENAVVEVEVYSPQKEPIMPGMPLTVVAPAKFVVPPNCLAEIIEIKNVNGIQRLILKLIPVKEMTSQPAKCKAAEYATQCAEQGEKTISGNMTPTFDDSCVLDHERYNNFGCVVSPGSTALSCNSINMHRENVICKENDGRENSLTTAVAELSPDEINSPEFFSRQKYAKSSHLNFGLNSSTCLTPSLSEGGNRPQNGLLDAVQESYSVSPSSVFDTKCFTLSNTEREHCNKLPITKTHLFYSSRPLESKVVESQQNKSVCLDGSKTVLATVNEKDMKSKKGNIDVDSSEAQNVKNEGGTSEGPVISSVFSLSSGAVNIPEGIKWDNTLRKKSSASLLCRKIAQLMSAAESNMKSQLAASLRHDRSPKEKKCSSLEAPEKLERNGSTPELETEPVPSPQRSTDAASPNEHSSREERAQPLEAPTMARPRRRVHRMHAASPVFIPPGTVLRVIDRISTKYLAGQENGNETLPSSIAFCSSTFLPRPVPCRVSEKCIQTPSSLPAENDVMKTSKNQSVSHRHRKKRKYIKTPSSLPAENDVMKTSKNQSVSHRHRKKRKYSMKSEQNRVLPHPKGSERNKPNEGAMKHKKTKKKCKQANVGEYLSKKRPRSQEDDCYIIKTEPILTRRLRLIPFKRDQLIKCPHRNQPVIVLNHPDVDSPEIINVMKVINKYKGNVLKAVLSERTISHLGVKRHHKRLTFQNFDRVTQMRKLNRLRMKLMKIHQNAYKVVNSSPAEASKQTFQCWFCSRVYIDQEEWISHGQKHLMEATRGWDGGSLESDKLEPICVL